MKKETQFTHIGRPKPGPGQPVNPSITRASTIVLDTAADLYRPGVRTYGRHGGDVHDALKEAFMALEGGAGCALTPSGLMACTLAIQSFVKAGDHILVTNSTYNPVRHFCDTFLSRMGVETEYYEPTIGGGIEAQIRENTSLIWLESPGSLTLDIQDLPALTKVAKAHDLVTVIDNTWSGGLTLQPFDLGVDVSVHAATKYFCGHSDILAGAVISKSQAHDKQVYATARALGMAFSPDDAYQILRGFRTVVSRFNKAADTALKLAQHLANKDQVATVLHPALQSHPQHTLFERDFTGGACLFSVELKPMPQDDVIALIDRLKLFGKGYSYGGFESLVIHCNPQMTQERRDAYAGPIIRFACGQENVEDLIIDIDHAFQ